MLFPDARRCVGAIVGVLLLFLQPSHPAATSAFHSASETQTSTSRLEYVGDDACASCHENKVNTFHRTAHYLTSQLPQAESILGSFAPAANILKTSNPDLFFRMDARAGGFFQTSIEGVDPYVTSRSERFALVVGSGGKGQTYLFWKGDQLFQLPVSYWRELGWVNSPGYRDGVGNFDRPVAPRCLECHATYFHSAPPPLNRYSESEFVVGMTCEKCHGPGRSHVQHYTSKTVASAESAILNPKKFSRERQMDLCAWCHAGAGTSIRAAFSYTAGEPLAKYLDLPQPDPTTALDVHGSQVELLRKSRCYLSSSMTCLTCHDVHVQQHDAASFSQICLGCHKPQTPAFPTHDHPANSDCIACHMPEQPTNLIVFDWRGNKVRPKVRTHWISIYARQDPH